jgi:hypothetical protein
MWACLARKGGALFWNKTAKIAAGIAAAQHLFNAKARGIGRALPGLLAIKSAKEARRGRVSDIGGQIDQFVEDNA